MIGFLFSWLTGAPQAKAEIDAKAGSKPHRALKHPFEGFEAINAEAVSSALSLKLVAIVAKGSPVPEWLLTVDPIKPGAARPSFKAAQQLHIYDWKGRYLVLPVSPECVLETFMDLGPHEGQVMVSGGERPVAMVRGLQVLGAPSLDDAELPATVAALIGKGA